MRRRHLLLLVFCLASVLPLWACAHEPAPQEAAREDAARELIEADERQVEACRYLGSVTARGNPNPILSRLATDSLKQDLRRRAAALGATHIVWLYAYDSTAAALAYRCPQE